MAAGLVLLHSKHTRPRQKGATELLSASASEIFWRGYKRPWTGHVA
jgi:hypothetical protein